MTKQTRHNRRKRAWLVATKLARGCEHCGYTPRTRADRLHFHHRDPNTKEFSLSNGCHSRSWSQLAAEVAKCDVLCDTCHKTTDSYGRK